MTSPLLVADLVGKSFGAKRVLSSASRSGTTYELGSRERARAHEQFQREYAGPIGC